MSAENQVMDYLDILGEIEDIATKDDINDLTRRMALKKIRDLINTVWDELEGNDDDEEDE